MKDKRCYVCGSIIHYPHDSCGMISGKPICTLCIADEEIKGLVIQPLWCWEDDDEP